MFTYVVLFGYQGCKKKYFPHDGGFESDVEDFVGLNEISLGMDVISLVLDCLYKRAKSDKNDSAKEPG